ncbi:MAG: NAD-dependent epimerase/dehydratase family protein [Candidatus Dormibacteraeota bacterium]|nr:NAD-dependent epimerase/dehydratase family protein [Candidatus Dormibacteraeota bacterium]
MATESDADRYTGRRVLVTGGSGFLGLNLLSALQRLSAKPRVLSRSPLPRSAAFAAVEQFTGDLRDEPLVQDAVRGCAVVFNLAAHSGSASSNVEPFVDLDTNLRGQLTLLEACRRLDPPPVVVYASSRLVYRPTEQLPVDESALTGPLSLYGIHKLAAENYHLLYRHLYGLKAVVLRITNPYGYSPRPPESRYSIINWFIHLALQGKVLPIYGEGRQLRDYIHVDDVTRAFLDAGSNPGADGAILNVGSGIGLSFTQMVEAVVAAAGSGVPRHVPWPPDAARVETGSFVADIARIEKALRWRPSIQFETGLVQVVRQYREMEQVT